MQTTRQADKPLTGLRILVADDAIDSQRLMQYVLVRGGAAVDIAHDGIDALERVAAETYDLILMDLHMPRMDGRAATRTLRSNGYAGTIIALTGDEPTARPRHDGFDGHETKPIDPHRFLQSVAKLTRTARSPDALVS